MLLLMMELKGRFNSKMIKKAKFGDVYFDEMGGFLSVERGVAGGGVSRYSHWFIIFRYGRLMVFPDRTL